MVHPLNNARHHLLCLAKKLADPHFVRVIGIDGPTASGKTILADWLSEELKDSGIKTWTYRLDWALADRAKRLTHLAQVKESNLPFAYEAELHMRLETVRDFLLEISAFNQRIREEVPDLKKEFQLEGLYSRENGGACTGTTTVNLEPGMIILLEGHYTLRNELDALIDKNVLLLCHPQELLKRKVNRVTGYRGAEEATDYFWRIDMPSFQLHLARYRWNADIVIDNTDFSAPNLVTPKFVTDWQMTCTSETPIRWNTENSELPVPEKLKDQTRKAIEMIHQWDHSVGRYLRTSLNEIHSDLEELAERLVRDLNTSPDKGPFHFDLTHTDSLHGVYYRKLPVTLGVGIRDERNELAVGLLTNIGQSALTIHVFWAGGHQELTYERKLGEIISNPSFSLSASTRSIPLAEVPLTGFNVFLPTAFTVPEFLKKADFVPVFTGREEENISASEALASLLGQGGGWIHRFALMSEIRFFSFCLDCCGIPNMRAGNYLLAFRHSDPTLSARFKAYSKSWAVPPLQKNLFQHVEASLDRLVVNERIEARDFVRNNCSEFRMRDGYLFSQFIYGDETTINKGLGELVQMLGCTNRFLRKRAIQFILEYFPGFAVPTNKMWKEVPSNADKEISLESFNLLGPTILAELYLWLALRGDSSAILGANIYDLSKNASDARAYLTAAVENRRPIVLQSSLNALGQREEENGKVVEGYLKPENGAIDFVQTCNTAARDLLLTRGQAPPLYGIGLDHVSSEHDHPRGRALRFFKPLLDTRGVTHLVLDGSSFFNAKDTSTKELSRAYSEVARFAASLIEDPHKMYLIDLELCAGEFNYVANEKVARVPEASELRLFVRSFQEQVRERGVDAVLGRPMLIAANLGTTHHGADGTPPAVETSASWKEALKNEGVVSAVLHGTSRSHRDVLARSTVGCHKVNVAGDFLETLVKNLPERIYSKIRRSKLEPKKVLADVREEMAKMTEQERTRLERALKEQAQDLMETICAPVLTPMDENYFRYSPCLYTTDQIRTIAEGLRERLRKNRDLSLSKLADSSVGCVFSVSMIEVPTEEANGDLSEMLWNEGIRYFHVDAGDGKFISRAFSGLEKIHFLRSRFPAASIRVHLMVENPHHSHGNTLSYIHQYAKAGADAIAIHPRSVLNTDEIDSALNLIRILGCRPGIVIETSDSINEKIKRLISRMNLDWAVVMGVPIGYGGQVFQYSTINKIATLHSYVTGLDRNFLIECDGGLNLDNIRFCKEAGAQVFSGWSIIKAPTNEQISERLKKVRQTLTVETRKERVLY